MLILRNRSIFNATFRTFTVFWRKKKIVRHNTLCFSTECPRTATITVSFKSDSAFVLYNICLKNNPIVNMGEILTVQFSTALYESELETSLECTCNSGLCLCQAAMWVSICRAQRENLPNYCYGLWSAKNWKQGFW